MELEGTKRSMKDIAKDSSKKIEHLVTDRHPSITKWLREETEITHVSYAFRLLSALPGTQSDAV